MSVEDEISGFIGKFAPHNQELIRGCRAAMARMFPEAVQLVYDNYNFFVIGFSPTRRPSHAIFSLAAQRHGLALCFLQHGPDLPDPEHLLHGSGKTVRSLPLLSPDDLVRPGVRDLLDAAVTIATVPMAVAEGPAVIVQSVSEKQRPRR